MPLMLLNTLVYTRYTFCNRENKNAGLVLRAICRAPTPPCKKKIVAIIYFCPKICEIFWSVCENVFPIFLHFCLRKFSFQISGTYEIFMNLIQRPGPGGGAPTNWGYRGAEPPHPIFFLDKIFFFFESSKTYAKQI